VDAQVIGQLGMERREEHSAGEREHGSAAEAREDRVARAHRHDFRRTDEHCVEGTIERLDRQVCREAVQLSAVRVPLERDRREAEPLGGALTLPEQDGACAGAEHR
jgi:hypothetical protein